ncbi:MAG: thioesterase [Chloroflexi bacterium AL-W]|nr:thioesterase [Chloroflexi bacterium AL-N1]NOK66813.1 thioesterase [Chloroflexi bacterium AL-N10]NOK74895.1 thioesterase [Chloroflexi bacterium AL-N5]NOK81416.1 thioesterase [Chloroflexi bacterium AL-W]NOK88885.1 thioesterase [Chloroflexi bacterium AL-N15]
MNISRFCRRLGITVHAATVTKVVLSAPLVLNINHRETVFGGSASAVAILSAWTLLHLRLDATGLPHRLVIQENTMSYDKPITDDLRAVCMFDEETIWARFITILTRKRMARIHVTAILECDGDIVGRFAGSFVALVRQST